MLEPSAPATLINPIIRGFQWRRASRDREHHLPILQASVWHELSCIHVQSHLHLWTVVPNVLTTLLGSPQAASQNAASTSCVISKGFFIPYGLSRELQRLTAVGDSRVWQMSQTLSQPDVFRLTQLLTPLIFKDRPPFPPYRLSPDQGAPTQSYSSQSSKVPLLLAHIMPVLVSFVLFAVR